MFPLLGFVWVEFDVENGPCVRDTFYGFNNHKTTYEPSEVLSATAKDFIAFHAMPDSTSVSSEISKMEESLFFFHVPCNLLCETELASYFWNDSGPCQGNFCYQAVQPVAHSLFRVTANQKARRGYDQSAIVAVCTTNVSTSFIRALLYIVAGKLFQEGTLSKNEMEKELGFLRHQFLQIMSGNEEKENSVRNCVKFLATELIVSGDYVLCPCGLTRQWCIHTVQFSDEESNLCSSMKTRDFPIIPLVKPNCNIPFFHEFDLYRCFSENLGYLWTLLELMMLGESILVVSSTPSQACSTVGCLLSLLVPLLPVDVNWQSYFIIQDLDECKNQKKQRNSLLGITSAFLYRQLEQFRNVLFIGQPVDRHTEMYPSLYLRTKYCRKFRKSKRFLKALKYSSQRLSTCIILREYFREVVLTILRIFNPFFTPLNAQEMKQMVQNYDKEDILQWLMQSPPKFHELDKSTFPSDHDIEVSSIMTLLSNRYALANKFLLDKKHLFYSSVNDPLSENDESDSSDDGEESDEDSSELSRDLESLQLSCGRASKKRSQVHLRKGIGHKLKAASRHRKLSKRRGIVRQFLKEFMNGPIFEEWFHKRKRQAEYRWYIRYKQIMTDVLNQLETLDIMQWRQLPSQWRDKLETHINYVREMQDTDLECRLMNTFTKLNNKC